MKGLCWFTIVFSIMFALFFTSCSGKKVNENNPDEFFNDAEKDVKDKHYLIALDKFKTIKNKFPYSHYSVKAHLRIADVYFLEEQFVEAAATYEAFRDLHPKHERADYVIFQIGESYFNQLPSSIDRDQTPATKAIEAFKELTRLYPQSKNVEKAHEHQKTATERLALKEKYIGDFYYKRNMFDSAAKRFQKITEEYSATSVEETAYWLWGKSLLEYSKQELSVEERAAALERAKKAYEVYLEKFPAGIYVADVKLVIKKMEK